MPVIQTGDITPDTSFTAHDNHQVYNGLDCCITTEVFQEISKLRTELPAIYNFERAMQAPYLDMMMRGFKIDQTARHRAAETLRTRLTHLERVLGTLAMA